MCRFCGSWPKFEFVPCAVAWRVGPSIAPSISIANQRCSVCPNEWLSIGWIFHRHYHLSALGISHSCVSHSCSSSLIHRNKTGNYRQSSRYLYRDRLLRMHRRTSGDESNPDSTSSSQFASSGADPNAFLEVDIAHVGEYDTALLGLLLGQPAGILPSLELAAVDALKTLLFDMQREVAGREDDSGDGENAAGGAAQGATQEGETAEGGADGNANNPGATSAAGEALPTPADLANISTSTIQILLRGNLTSTPLRCIQSKHMNTLLRIPGIVISASRVRSRAHTIKVRCARCMDERIVHSTTGPFGGVAIPQRCMGEWFYYLFDCLNST